jgi:hypothetical protein
MMFEVTEQTRSVLMQQVLDIVRENFIVATVGGCILAGMLLKSLTAMVTSSARERSRREIAAYIAEGSITPDQGERLMRAEVSGKGPANC